MGVWHRFVQHRGQGCETSDTGLGLVEILVAITLLAGALIGTAGEVAAYVQQQVVERSQVNANHLADSWFEYAESQENGAVTTPLASGSAITVGAAGATPITTAATTTTTVSGVTFTEATTPTICQAADVAKTPFSLSSCTGGSVTPTSTIYSTIKITWSVGGHSHQLTMTRNLTNNETYQPPDTNDPGGNALSNCTRAVPTGGSVTLDQLSVVPATAATYNGATNPVTGRAYADGSSGYVTKDAAGNSITTTGDVITLRETGLANVSDTSQTGFGAPTCVPLLWTDSIGTHQVDMHSATTGDGGCAGSVVTKSTVSTQVCKYTATIPYTDIDILPTSASSSLPNVSAANLWDATVEFCAYLIGSGGCSTSTAQSTSVAVSPMYVNAGPALSCTVGTPTRVAGRTLFATAVNCTATNVTKTDTMVVTYPGGGTLSPAMTSTNGTTWTGSLPAGTTYPAGQGTWNFTITRSTTGEDKEVATTSVSVTPL